MLTLADTYNEPVSEGRAEAYFRALSDLPIETVEQLVTLVTRTSKFFPRPADLRELLPSAVPELGDAWAELRRAQWSWRPWKHAPQVSEAVSELVAQCGGWRSITEMSEESLWHRVRQIYPVVRERVVASGCDPRQLMMDDKKQLEHKP